MTKKFVRFFLGWYTLRMPTMKMITPEPLTQSVLAAHTAISPDDAPSLQNIASSLAGKRVLHVSSSARGGGVAELLRGGCAFERALGIESAWAVIEDAADFFVITKKIHNGLQGAAHMIDSVEQAAYLEIAATLHEQFETIIRNIRPDLIILHDPQPLPLISQARQHAPVISRLHVDLSTPYKPIAEFLMPMLQQTSGIILSSSNYRSAIEPYPKNQTVIIRPAIDPLAEKNSPLDKSLAQSILEKHGIDTAHPFITQVSRFDVWKDPLGAIDAYRIAKQSLPTLQLILAGFIEASDDPEALEWVAKTTSAASGDPDIHIFSDLSQLKHGTSNTLFINAINTLTNCTLQMSRREGFGLTITEAMWKARVVIARPSRGAELQINHGENGYLADTPETVAHHIIETLSDTKKAQALGRAAQESVRAHFLLPHYVRLNCQSYFRTIAREPLIKDDDQPSA